MISRCSILSAASELIARMRAARMTMVVMGMEAISECDGVVAVLIMDRELAQ